MSAGEFQEFCALLAEEDGLVTPRQHSLSLSGENWRDGASAVMSAFGFPDAVKVGAACE